MTNKLIALIVCSFLAVTNLFAADPAERPAAPATTAPAPAKEIKAIGPERIQLPASRGTVNFPHRKHQEMLKDCTTCHACKTGKLPELSKVWAHNTCRGCHNETSKAPVQCSGCHGATVPNK